ncbi:hypothetical protein G9A89_020142 [Geosiphon pyriformis]|nr:hypothetical protein G9A89_020142 [Geosiphon pyriformis]
MGLPRETEWRGEISKFKSQKNFLKYPNSFPNLYMPSSSINSSQNLVKAVEIVKASQDSLIETSWKQNMALGRRGIFDIFRRPTNTDESPKYFKQPAQKWELSFLKQIAKIISKSYCTNGVWLFKSPGLSAVLDMNADIISSSNYAGKSVAFIFKGRELSYAGINMLTDRSHFGDYNKELVAGAVVATELYQNRFQRVENDLNKIFLQFTSDRKFSRHSFTFAGHGEGGAFAVYAALAFRRLKETKKRTIHVVTFGELRHGNKVFSSYVDEQLNHVYRVTKMDDFVPLFEWPKIYENPSLRFQHHLHEYWIPLVDCNCSDQDAAEQMSDNFAWVCCSPSGAESQDCINKYAPTPPEPPGRWTRAHFGPYFGVTISYQC